ncbi:MAG: GNAT family N-acetyltransferase, partial [Vicinamibacterales bacterium]
PAAAIAATDVSTPPAFTIRRADIADIALLARHRAWMFRNMGHLPSHLEAPLERATAAYLREAMPRGEYIAWVAESGAVSAAAVGGAGVQLRPILPRPRPIRGPDGLELGPEALVLNVYVEPDWRRRGVAEALMRTLLGALAARGIRRIVLHASDDGRRLYERLGFVQTNEMRFEPA